MWTRIGVATQVDAITWTNFIGRAGKQEFSTYLLAWGTSSGEASNPLRALIATYTPAKGWGTANRGRYSNPAVDALLDKALSTGDDKAREQILISATRTAMTDLPFIPLHIQKNIWAMRAGLTYIPRVDEETYVTDLRPAR
jgi:peptide/nickel transport system substrate-binding protein